MKNDITKAEKTTNMIARDAKYSRGIRKPEQLQQDALENPTHYVGVTYEERIEFLKKNGYEITRENIINGELPAVDSPE